MPEYTFKYIIPVLSGACLVTLCYLSITYFQMDNPPYQLAFAAILVIWIMVQVIRRVPGPKLNIAFIDKILSIEKQMHKPEIDQYATPDALVIFNSRTKLIFGIIFYLIGAAAVVYATYTKDQPLFFIGALITYYCLNAVYAFSKQLADEGPQLIFNYEGVATPELGFVPWAEVKIIRLRDTSSSETSSTNLDIFRSNSEKPDFTVMIDTFNIGKYKLRKALEEFTKREIPSV